MKPGTSLIELLIAVAVISIILITLTAAASQSLSAGIFSKTQARATKLAEEQIERVRALRDRSGLAAISCPAPSICSLDTGLTKSTSDIKVENLSVWFQTVVPGSCQGSATEVTAYAQWTDAKGDHRSKVVSCFSDWRG